MTREALAAWYGSADVADMVLAGRLGNLQRTLAAIERVQAIRGRRGTGAPAAKKRTKPHGQTQSIWGPRDRVIRELWGVESIAEIARRLGADAVEVRIRGVRLGLDVAVGKLPGRRALSVLAKSRIGEARKSSGWGFSHRRVPAVDGAPDVRAAVARGAASVFHLGACA